MMDVLHFICPCCCSDGEESAYTKSSERNPSVHRRNNSLRDSLREHVRRSMENLLFIEDRPSGRRSVAYPVEIEVESDRKLRKENAKMVQSSKCRFEKKSVSSPNLPSKETPKKLPRSVSTIPPTVHQYHSQTFSPSHSVETIIVQIPKKIQTSDLKKSKSIQVTASVPNSGNKLESKSTLKVDIATYVSSKETVKYVKSSPSMKALNDKNIQNSNPKLGKKSVGQESSDVGDGKGIEPKSTKIEKIDPETKKSERPVPKRLLKTISGSTQVGFKMKSASDKKVGKKGAPENKKDPAVEKKPMKSIGRQKVKSKMGDLKIGSKSKRILRKIQVPEDKKPEDPAGEKKPLKSIGHQNERSKMGDFKIESKSERILRKIQVPEKPVDPAVEKKPLKSIGHQNERSKMGDFKIESKSERILRKIDVPEDKMSDVPAVEKKQQSRSHQSLKDKVESTCDEKLEKIAAPASEEPAVEKRATGVTANLDQEVKTLEEKEKETNESNEESPEEESLPGEAEPCVSLSSPSTPNYVRPLSAPQIEEINEKFPVPRMITFRPMMPPHKPHRTPRRIRAKPKRKSLLKVAEPKKEKEKTPPSPTPSPFRKVAACVEKYYKEDSYDIPSNLRPRDYVKGNDPYDDYWKKPKLTVLEPIDFPKDCVRLSYPNTRDYSYRKFVPHLLKTPLPPSCGKDKRFFELKPPVKYEEEDKKEDSVPEEPLLSSSSDKWVPPIDVVLRHTPKIRYNIPPCKKDKIESSKKESSNFNKTSKEPEIQKSKNSNETELKKSKSYPIKNMGKVLTKKQVDKREERKTILTSSIHNIDGSPNLLPNTSKNDKIEVRKEKKISFEKSAEGILGGKEKVLPSISSRPSPEIKSYSSQVAPLPPLESKQNVILKNKDSNQLLTSYVLYCLNICNYSY